MRYSLLKNLIYVLSLFIVISHNVFADQKAEEIIKRYDIGYYHPERFGLRDFVVDVRVDGLTEKLNQQLIFGKLNDVHFKVYWMLDGGVENDDSRYQIFVIGLPNGFEEMKKGLKQMISTRIDYIVPKMLISGLKEYEMVHSPSGDNSLITCTDTTHRKDVDRVEIYFGDSGRMVRYGTYSPAGRTDSLLKMSAKPWSNNKWVIDELLVKKYQGIQTTEIEYGFIYEKYEKFGLPKEITVETRQKLSRPTDIKEQKLMQKINTNLYFSNYIINKGIAKQVILGK